MELGWQRRGRYDRTTMADPLHTIAVTLRDAFAAVTGLPAADIDPVVRASDRADAQANGALALAKQLGRNPRELAEAVVATGVLGSVCSNAEVAGPGFINLTFTPEFLGAQLAEAAADSRVGVRPAATAEIAVVDYSAPNVAKEMHVGHLRTTVIGDALVRMLEFVGHTVIRENHIGDWGTPFGMLIEHMVDLGGVDTELTIDLSDPSAFYKRARAKFDASDEFKDRARARVTLLQSRTDAPTMAIWDKLVDKSADYFDVVYGKLGVLLRRDDIVGESFYQPMMPAMLQRLDGAGLLAESDGAKVVWVPGFKNREGEPLPLIVQARTGGFNYATSDITCVLDRVERLHATLLVYCIGTPQSQHLQMVFKAAEMLGVLVPPTRAVHVNNGNVLGEDRKILKSRSGEPAMLLDLVDAAIERGRAIVAERSPELPADEQATLANRIGIGALKYAELPATGSRTMFSTGRACSRWTATPRRTCSTRTLVSAASSARAASSGRRSVRSCPASASRRSVRSRCSCCSSMRSCTTRSTSSARTGCARTCSRLRRRSPRSTRRARC